MTRFNMENLVFHIFILAVMITVTQSDATTVTARVGDTVILRCPVPPDYNIVMWYKGTSDLIARQTPQDSFILRNQDRMDLYNGGYLRINKTTLDDLGMYTCHIKTQHDLHVTKYKVQFQMELLPTFPVSTVHDDWTPHLLGCKVRLRQGARLRSVAWYIGAQLEGALAIYKPGTMVQPFIYNPYEEAYDVINGTTLKILKRPRDSDVIYTCHVLILGYDHVLSYNASLDLAVTEDPDDYVTGTSFPEVTTDTMTSESNNQKLVITEKVIIPTTAEPTTAKPTTVRTITTRAPPTEAPTTIAPSTETHTTLEPSTEVQTTTTVTVEPTTVRTTTTVEPTTVRTTTTTTIATTTTTTLPPTTQAPTTETPTTIAPTTTYPTTVQPTTVASTVEVPTTVETSSAAPTTLSSRPTTVTSQAPIAIKRDVISTDSTASPQAHTVAGTPVSSVKVTQNVTVHPGVDPLLACTVYLRGHTKVRTLAWYRGNQSVCWRDWQNPRHCIHGYELINSTYLLIKLKNWSHDEVFTCQVRVDGQDHVAVSGTRLVLENPTAAGDEYTKVKLDIVGSDSAETQYKASSNGKDKNSILKWVLIGVAVTLAIIATVLVFALLYVFVLNKASAKYEVNPRDANVSQTLL